MFDSVKLSLWKEMSFHELTNNPCFLLLQSLINKIEVEKASKETTTTRLIIKARDQDDPLVIGLSMPNLQKVRFSDGISAHRPELFKKLLEKTELSSSFGILPVK
jgi:hypothetical protein